MHVELKSRVQCRHSKNAMAFLNMMTLEETPRVFVYSLQIL